jgi:hypothetical protein
MGFLQDRAKKALLKGFESIDDDRLIEVIILLIVSREIPISAVEAAYYEQAETRKKQLEQKPLLKRIEQNERFEAP